MRRLAVGVPTAREDLLDTAGTGGGRRTFNVSTTAALIAAGAGCAVAKHGNRSATSFSGSADLLEALGARIDLGPDRVAACIERAGFGFMFAPLHHAATRYVVPVRHELAVRTVFNLLGPLTNPAGATRQLIGVADPALLHTFAGVLVRLGVERALIVSGEDGIDEVSTTAATQIVEVVGEEIRSYTLVPGDAGVALAAGEDVELLAGGTPQENAAVTEAILEGEQGPRADLAAINAGAAIYAGGAAASIVEGVQAAREAIADGRALAALHRYVDVSRGESSDGSTSTRDSSAGGGSAGAGSAPAGSASEGAREAR